MQAQSAGKAMFFATQLPMSTESQCMSSHKAQGFEWTTRFHARQSVPALYLLSAGKFFWYLLFTLLTLLYYTFYGLLAVVLSPNLQVSSVASTLFYAIWNLFSGFLITLPQMPVCFVSLPLILSCLLLSARAPDVQRAHMSLSALCNDAATSRANCKTGLISGCYSWKSASELCGNRGKMNPSKDAVAGMVVMVPLPVPCVLVLLGPRDNPAGRCEGDDDAAGWHRHPGQATTCVYGSSDTDVKKLRLERRWSSGRSED